MGVWQSPVPALQGIGRRQINTVMDERIPHITGKCLRTTESVLDLWCGVPQVDAGRGPLADAPASPRKRARDAASLQCRGCDRGVAQGVSAAAVVADNWARRQR